MGVIYEALNLVNGYRYIGKTSGGLIERKKSHFWDVGRGRRTFFLNALRKYKDHFVWLLVEEVEESKLNEREIFWINFARKEGLFLYNMTDGGDGVRGMASGFKGKHHSAKSRLKMSLSHSGEKHHLFGKNISQETKDKMSASNRGRKFSEEHRSKLRGRKFSEEHKKKLRESALGRHISEETKRKISSTLSGRVLSKDTRKKMSEARKVYWGNYKRQKNEMTLGGVI